MPLSGEAIRTMNYVDDISVTLRRILAVLPSLTEDERQRVADHRHLSRATSPSSQLCRAQSNVGRFSFGRSSG
jgi:hypothetical protein